jgi:hypothetical protein
MLARLCLRFFLALPLALVLLTGSLSLSHSALAGTISEIKYYIKPVLQDNQIIVEPNYGQLLESDVDADEALAKIKDKAMSKVQEDYEIKETQPIWTQRHVLGEVPNLILHVEEESKE